MPRDTSGTLRSPDRSTSPGCDRFSGATSKPCGMYRRFGHQHLSFLFWSGGRMFWSRKTTVRWIEGDFIILKVVSFLVFQVK